MAFAKTTETPVFLVGHVTKDGSLAGPKVLEHVVDLDVMLSLASGRKVKLALIGCGWYGLVDVAAAFKAGGVEVAGICDVDETCPGNSPDATR